MAHDSRSRVWVLSQQFALARVTTHSRCSHSQPVSMTTDVALLHAHGERESSTFV